MRQMHHWAANIFVGSIVVHMLRVFFTGAFRRPREINWMVGATLLILAIFNGFLGYSLPDDLISGTGIRIAFSILESVPLVGSYLAFFLFGGNYPGQRHHHSALLHPPRADPAARHPRRCSARTSGCSSATSTPSSPAEGAREDNVVGTPMWPGVRRQDDGLLVPDRRRHRAARCASSRSTRSGCTDRTCRTR